MHHFTLTLTPLENLNGKMKLNSEIEKITNQQMEVNTSQKNNEEMKWVFIERKKR